MALSFVPYQPYIDDSGRGLGVGYQRGNLIYDPRGDAFPFIYSSSENDGVVWVLNRRTGVITDQFAQFWGYLDGGADMDENGNLWWGGIDPDNLTQSRQSRTKFTADTLVRINSVTTDGSTIFYPGIGLIRVDRHSTQHLVWHLETADIHEGHGNLTAWNNSALVVIYSLSRTSWDNVPVGGVSNRVFDIDSDGDGNLWAVSRDDTATYTLLWKVEPDGTQTLVTNLTADFPDGIPPTIKWVAANNTLVVAAGNTLAQYDMTGALILKVTPPIFIDPATNYGSFRHTLDSVTDVYLSSGWPSGPIFYQIDLLTLATVNTYDFTSVSGIVDVFYNGFSHSYDPPRRFRAIGALYDPLVNSIWAEDFNQGVFGQFNLGVPPPPEIRTTQIIAEVVMRPHPTTTPVLPPPPQVFVGKNLFALVGAAQPMEVCSGYIGKPAVHSQLSQVEAHYNKDLAPLSSELHAFHTEQIGEKDIEGRQAVIWKENPWFNLRQTNRYHRVCLFCRGDTEVIALTWMLREAGIR